MVICIDFTKQMLLWVFDPLHATLTFGVEGCVQRARRIRGVAQRPSHSKRA